MKKHYKITESESRKNEKPCYLYVLRHIEEDGEQNTKIGVSYDPVKRCRDCTSSYGYLFFLYRTYEMSRETALKIEETLKKKYSHLTIKKWKEVFSHSPEAIHSDIMGEIKRIGGEYARSHYPA